MKAQDPSTQSLFLALRDSPLFTNLGEEILLEIARLSYTRRISKGAFIFFQTDPAEAMYLVTSGAVSILLTSEDGRELVINEMIPGNWFGELGLLTGQPRSTSALARQDTELIVIPRTAFMAGIEADPRILRRLLDTTAQRLSASSERESALAFLDAPARLARVLLEQDSLDSEKGLITISQEELARRASLTRQTVAVTLGRWRRLGWLITGRGKIMLLDREALKKQCSGQ